MFTQIALSKIDAIQTELAVLRDRVSKLEAAQKDPTSAYIKAANVLRANNEFGAASIIQARNDNTPQAGLAKSGVHITGGVGGHGEIGSCNHSQGVQERNDNAPQGGLQARNDAWSAYAAQGAQMGINPQTGNYQISKGNYLGENRRKATTDRRKS